RKDPTGGRSADPNAGYYIPWELIGQATGVALATMLVLAYAMKLLRRLRGATAMHVYRAFLDHLSDLGERRREGESRERHAQRLAALAPSFAKLTDAHLRWALGPPAKGDVVAEHRALADAARAELARSVRLRRRIVGFLHPLGWLFTR
ncbi:MAG TPA: hypothetical protein VK427_17645, partial [Kofleriaceae bacterium]|nr:hypothetical protein [Kofleriaceae bacterium]